MVSERIGGTGMNGERFIDGHNHLWIRTERRVPLLEDGPWHPLLGNVTALPRDYRFGDLGDDWGHRRLLGSVHVEAQTGDPLAEAEWLNRIALSTPSNVVVATLPDTPDVREYLMRLTGLERVRGVRAFRPQPGEFLEGNAGFVSRYDDPAFREVVAAVAAAGLTLDIRATPRDLPVVAEIATAWPGLPVAVNHGGFPFIPGEAGHAIWLAGLDAIADCPNVVVKYSGFAMGEHGLDPRVLERWSSALLQRFGADRLLFGSNFPVDRLYTSLDRLVDLYHSLLEGVGAAAHERIFRRNAQRIYRMGEA